MTKDTYTLRLNQVRQRSQVANSEPMVLSMTRIKRQASNDYLLDLFIDKLGLARTLVKFRPNFQELRNTGITSV